MLSRFRHIFGVVFFLLIASCSGGGCGGCGGGAGTTPLPGGFPKEQAIENAASVRVSRAGLDFLEKEIPAIATKALNAPGGKMKFNIPEAPFNQNDAFSVGPCPLCVKFDISGAICPGGANPNATPPRCVAEAEVAKSSFVIDSVTPNAVEIRATIPLRLDDTPVNANIDPGPEVTLHIGYGANSSCNGDKPNVQIKNLTVPIRIPLVAETTSPRDGYTKIDIGGATIDLNGISADDVRICADCGIFPDGLCNSVLNWSFFKNFIVDALRDQLDDQIKNLLADQLCTAPVPTLNPPCPSGSKPDKDNKHCVYNSDPNKCVSLLLGTDMHVDLGGALRSISPGTGGGLDFGLAAAGAMQPFPNLPKNAQGRSPNGITLGLMGGAIAQPISNCVPEAKLTPPQGIPFPDELAPKAADPAGTPHVGIALAGRFLDFTMGSVYNSGLLCLGVSTEQFEMLKSGLLSFLIPSLKTITFEQQDAAVAIATRPQKPPTVKIGGGTDATADPLMLITIPELSIDFYIWSFDRFARVFTYTGDLAVPVNLQTGKDPVKNPKGGIIPAIGELKISNGKISNADALLLDDPNIVAGAVSGVFGTVSKQLVGSGFSPIDLSSALSSFGLGMEINTIKKLTKDQDDFVGVFATMNKPPQAATPEADVTAKLVDKRVWKDHMSAATFDAAKLPELEIVVSSSLDGGDRPIEYSWWIDNGTRSPWIEAPNGRLVIKDSQLFMQGKHVLRISARVEGDAATEDTTPAEIPYVIDALAPQVKVEKDGANAKIDAWDIVTKKSDLLARYRFDDGEMTEWRPLADVAIVNAGAAGTIDVEVKDEEGNIGQVQQALIRGRGDPTIAAAGSGCGCSTPGSKSSPADMLVLALGVLGIGAIVLRRRGLLGAKSKTTALALGTICAVAATSEGCACGSDDDPGTGCGTDCNQECATGLAHGQPGAYLSVAKAPDGAIWAAGYNDAMLSEGDAFLWGDLVVGKYDLGKQGVDWETVDGIPTRTDGTCPNYEPYGWRKGETESGDNVGLWTSIQVAPSGQPIVSYYDSTNKRLKLAVRDGDQWITSVIKEQAGADVGRYGKMVLVDNKPVITFLVMEPFGGKTRAKVMVARSRVEVPKSGEDFGFEDAVVEDDNPCRAGTCGGGEACIKETGLCTKTVAGCDPACGQSESCVTKDNKATCLANTSSVETYPRVFGARLAMASGPGGLGIVAYDAYHGNLVALIDRGGGKWDRALIDGETGNRADKTALDTGDVGIAAALTIAGGTWHVSYVNGLDESLRYITVNDGKPGKSEIVDDGTGVDGSTFPDGKHIVGDDSTIKVDGDIVTIYYSDSTSLGLRKASGATSGGSRKWTLSSIKEANRWVAFPQIVPGEDKVAAWWRQSTRSSKTVEGDVKLFP